MKNELVVKRGSDNIFADLGLPNAEQHKLKAQIAAMISQAIRKHGLTQVEAAERMGLKQPDVSKLLRGRFEGFSLERLLGFLMALGMNVKIDVEPANENAPGYLCLAYG